jgi:hypothetical protein
LAEDLVAQAREEGVQLVGEGGLLTGLTKAVVETALEGEISGHLGSGVPTCRRIRRTARWSSPGDHQPVATGVAGVHPVPGLRSLSQYLAMLGRFYERRRWAQREVCRGVCASLPGMAAAFLLENAVLVRCLEFDGVLGCLWFRLPGSLGRSS